MSRGVVLLGFAESLAAPECAWDLLDAGYDVVAFARRSRRAGLRGSRLVPVMDITPPEDSLSGALGDLGALVERLRPMAIFPTDDVALLLSSRRGDVPIAAATARAADLALDKEVQYEMARDVGFPVPPTVMWDEGEPPPGNEISFPAVIKPVDAVQVVGDRVSRAGARIVSDQVSLGRARTELHGRLSLQPWVQGTGTGVFGIVVNGTFLHVSAHRRVRMMNPKGSGSSACASIDVPVGVLGQIEDLLDRVSWDGIVMVEFLRATHDGSLWFMEVNGRAWGSMALALARGLTYPRWAIEQALGKDLSPGPTSPVARHARHVGRELVHVAAVWRGPGAADIAWPDPRTATAEVLSVSRDDRVYNWRARDPGVFFLDTWTVLAEQVKGLRR